MGPAKLVRANETTDLSMRSKKCGHPHTDQKCPFLDSGHLRPKCINHYGVPDGRMGMSRVADELATVRPGPMGAAAPNACRRARTQAARHARRETSDAAGPRPGSGPDEPCRDCDAVSGPTALGYLPAEQGY